jgi:AcrR family transcriptional regulator
VDDPSEDVVDTGSARRRELLDRAYGYVLDHGMRELSLRPLAAAIGSSPRVLLYLFGSKDGLVRAVLARATAAERAGLTAIPHPTEGTDAALAAHGRYLWQWLASPRHQGLLRLWAESYANSLIDSDGPLAGFARQTVHEWLGLLTSTCGKPPSGAELTQATLLLAVLRGAILDLLATGDVDRTTAAVETHLRHLIEGSPPPPHPTPP